MLIVLFSLLLLIGSCNGFIPSFLTSSGLSSHTLKLQPLKNGDVVVLTLSPSRYLMGVVDTSKQEMHKLTLRPDDDLVDPYSGDVKFFYDESDYDNRSPSSESVSSGTNQAITNIIGSSGSSISLSLLSHLEDADVLVVDEDSVMVAQRQVIDRTINPHSEESEDVFYITASALPPAVLRKAGWHTPASL